MIMMVVIGDGEGHTESIEGGVNNEQTINETKELRGQKEPKTTMISFSYTSGYKLTVMIKRCNTGVTRSTMM